MPLPHEDQDEEETVTQALDPPDAVVKRTKEVDSEVGKLSTALEDLLSKQKAYAASLSTIGDLLDKAAPDDADWLGSVADELNAWPSTSEEASASTGVAINDKLAPFKEHCLNAATVRAKAYEEAYSAHKDAKAKAGGKPDKKRLQALQQAEREALSKAQAAQEVSTEQLRLMEEDYETTLLNTTRDVLHAQLMLHAKGIEAFTKAMQLLPAESK